MQIDRKDKDGIIILSVSGRLDAVSSIEAEKEFCTILDAGHDTFLIELGGVDYISSAGLRVLLVLAKRIQQKGGRVALAGMVAGVKEVFEISGFSSIFKIFDEVSDAEDYILSC